MLNLNFSSPLTLDSKLFQISIIICNIQVCHLGAFWNSHFITKQEVILCEIWDTEFQHCLSMNDRFNLDDAPYVIRGQELAAIWFKITLISASALLLAITIFMIIIKYVDRTCWLVKLMSWEHFAILPLCIVSSSKQ